MVKNIIYLGGNDPRIYKRGVEVAIMDQVASYKLGIKYYIFFGDKKEVFKWGKLIAISIKDTVFKYILLNILIARLRLRYAKNIIIHSHSPVKTQALFFKTDILTIHDAIFYQRKSGKQWNYPVFYLIEKMAYCKTNKFHFISYFAYSQSLLSERRFKKDAIVIYDTTPVELYMYNLKTILNYPFSREKMNIFTIRGIQERTRIDLLLDFAEYVKDKNINGKKIHVYIAGKGHMLEYYRQEQEKRKINNLTFLGYVSDELMCAYYKYCDLVILPSEFAEGFGLPLIEAYYFDKPVIASNRCAIPEIIISNDFLFENTPESIWKTLCNSFSLSFNFRAFYDLKYSNTVIFTEYKKLYDSFEKQIN
jgi:glycosyltransferase involved in cell wall biosynthesis